MNFSVAGNAATGFVLAMIGLRIRFRVGLADRQRQ